MVVLLRKIKIIGYLQSFNCKTNQEVYKAFEPTNMCIPRERLNIASDDFLVLQPMNTTGGFLAN